MGELTKIQWTDYTFNGWVGCRKVAAECANCYAETLDRNRFSKTLGEATKENPISHWGSGPRHRTSESNWKQPLKWNKYAGSYPDKCTQCDRRLCLDAQIQIGNTNCPAKYNKGKFDPSLPSCGGFVQRNVRPRVFCASLADWLDDENVPIEWFANLLQVVHATPNLDWLLLTKRPQNWQDRTVAAFEFAMKNGKDEGPQMDFTDWLGGWAHAAVAPHNVWIGVSAGADQGAALAIPAVVHFLSCEPMLWPLDTTHAARFDWIIFGGESGKNARLCDLDWIRTGLRFCRENGVAPFVKQLGSKAFFNHNDPADNERIHWDNADEFEREQFATRMGEYMEKCGLLEFKDSHGGDMAEWPEDLRVREFPYSGGEGK